MKKIIKVRLKENGYPVYLGYPLGDLGKKIVQLSPGSKVMVITDTRVKELYGDIVARSIGTAGNKVGIVAVKPGESSKTFKKAYDILKECSAFGMERSDTIVALGGGVPGDLAGFVASIYMRGIKFVTVPTTLLAQVDAAIGGKTAIDLPWGKNLVGSFYQPSFVFIDTEVLGTLDEREIRQGMAEIIKYGMIRSEEIFRHLENLPAEDVRRELLPVIRWCVEIKADIVSRDEKESGLREILNFGHTIGHAIEMAYMPKYTHGEAVALGMLSETSYAVGRSFCDRQTLKRLAALVARFGLPCNLDKVSPRRIADYLRHDKKNRAGKLRLVLPKTIGTVVRGVEVEVEEFLSKWRYCDEKR